MSASQRRSPDEILGALKRNTKAEKGRLRVFLGMCPGVGKTFSMLEAARQQSARGLRVLGGVIETHGRKETQRLLEGLELVPLREAVYKETTLREMDLDRILAEKPDLVLVDELAHSNIPESRHAKRFQDVEELLQAGIDVYTTLNIQHLESRNDLVAQITGVLVRETVPDSFLDLADQIELIDLSPEELLQRLAEGKVYLGEGAARAKEGFFKVEHLMALRELSLRFVAERVDQDLQDQMTIKGIEGPWNTKERLLVAVNASPYSSRLIRTARRMAANLEAPWIAVYVNTGEELSRVDEEMLQKNISLARELGAEIITMSDGDVVRALQKISQDRNVTQIIMGRPDRRIFRDLFSQGTILDRLVRETSKVDIHVIRAERKSRYRSFKFRWPNRTSGLVAYYNTVWFLFAIAFLCRLLLDIVGYRALGSIFLFSILVVAVLAGPGPTLLAATFAAVAWNFFFIPPTWTFAINSTEDFMMLTSFFVAALAGGFLTSRIRKQEQALELRERQSRLLYELVKNLSEHQDEEKIANALKEIIYRQFKTTSVVLLSDSNGKVGALRSEGRNLGEKEMAVAQWCLDNRKSAGWSTATLSAAPCLCLPMRAHSGVVGVLVFFPKSATRSLELEAENFLETIATQTALVVERLRYQSTAEKTKLYEASEKLHQTLLNSVSHELRTPITAIIGSTSALADEGPAINPESRKMLSKEIIAAAKRLDRVVENLLDVSRLEKGTLQLKNEWFELSELFSDLKNSLIEDLQGRALQIECPEGTLLDGDFQLLEHAFTQILLNAIKYSSPGTPISIFVTTRSQSVSILFIDQGRGIPQGLEGQIFQKFFRAPGAPSGGLGLGLSIVKNIIELHGGSVLVRNRPDELGGAQFEVDLPLKVPPKKLQEAMGD